MHTNKPWLLFASITTLFWGIWGAFIEIPEKAGFPATLGYSIWAFTMVPCALVALYIIKWKLNVDKRSIFLGCVVGLTGSGGQLLLFQALRSGPAYIVFPLISLFPILTIFLSIVFLKERGTIRQWIGIAVALIAIGFLSYQPASGDEVRDYSWLLLSILVFILWGVQAYAMKFSNYTMNAESIFFYMMVTAILLIPVALVMTDFSRPINLEFKGPYLAAIIHMLNAVGALTLVYALRYGKAMIVVPITGLSPLITVVISLVLYNVIPGPILGTGVILAMIGIYLLSE
jgi:uncharacterized membrane protein